MTHFNPGGHKRKADDAGVGGREGIPKRTNISNDDMDQIVGLVADAVQQLYDENAENVDELSPRFTGLSQEDFEFLIWRTNLASSLTQNFSDSQESSFSSQESSFPGSPTTFEFGLENEDFVMSSQPAEEDNYAITQSQTGEQPPSEVEFTIDQDYIKETATHLVDSVWEELLLAVADTSDISQLGGDPAVQKIYSDYLQDVENYISSLLNEGSEDDNWKPYT